MPEENKSCPTFRTMIGGQALIEGIMMMGPDKKSIVVRKPDGELEIKTEERKLLKDRYPILGWPLIRGVASFILSLYTGVTALMYSAEFVPEDSEDHEEPSRFEVWLEKHLGSEKAAGIFTTLAVVLGICFSVVLFILLPTLISGGIGWLIPAMPLWVRSVIEGVTRMVIFLGYLIACSHMKEIRRVISYHGAEHKSIACYEAGEELTPENAMRFRRFHPRCGTSFLFLAIIISIIVNAFVRVDGLWLRTGIKLLLLPLVVGLTYEVIKFAGRHDNPVTRVLSAPGLALQRLTTQEPDEEILEVAIASLKAVLPKDGEDDTW